MDNEGSLFSKIKNFITSRKRSDFVSEYLFTANARSSVYVCVIVAALELFMIGMMLCGVIQNSESYSQKWLFAHLIAYIALLASSIVMLAYSVLYLKGKIKNKAAGRAIKAFFSVAMVLFGLYISYTSKDRGGQVFAFITIVIFLNCLLVWHPLVSFFSLTTVFLTYIYLQSKLIPISLSIKINAFTTWLAFFAAALAERALGKAVAVRQPDRTSKQALFLQCGRGFFGRPKEQHRRLLLCLYGRRELQELQ